MNLVKFPLFELSVIYACHSYVNVHILTTYQHVAGDWKGMYHPQHIIPAPEIFHFSSPTLEPWTYELRAFCGLVLMLWRGIFILTHSCHRLHSMTTQSINYFSVTSVRWSAIHYLWENTHTPVVLFIHQCPVLTFVVGRLCWQYST